MNKTLSVNIGGYIFNIEEEAYHRLREYLDTISSYFSGQEGSDEIISDIEARIAELFNEHLGADRQVVLLSDVDQVITIMGKPEQYADAADEDQAQSNSSKSKSSENRRFYRDKDNAMLGGVCSGFSHHLGWDPLLLRAIFILLLFTSIGIPLYIILWIIVPAANTTAEKLKMRGEKINVENISKKINEEMDHVKSKFSSSGKSEASNAMNKLISGLGEVLSVLASFLRVLIGVAFLAAGIAMLIGFIIAVGGFSTGVPGNPELSIRFLQDYIFFNPHMFTLAAIAAILLLVTPFLYFIYLGVRLLLRIQPPIKGIGVTLLGMFILGSILAAIASINQAKEFAYDEAFVVRQPQSDLAVDELIVEVTEDDIWHNQINSYHLSPWEKMKIEDDQLYFADPRFTIQTSESELFVFEVSYESSGASSKNALEHAEQIAYSYQLDSNVVRLAPVFSVPSDVKYRDQEVTFTLRIPEGKSVYISEGTQRLLSSYFRWEGRRTRDIPGNTFINKNREIICTSCESLDD